MSGSSARLWALAGALCLLVLAADQVAKALVESDLVPGEYVEVLGPLELTLSHNRGVAFGLADGAGIGLVAVTLAALGLIVYLFARDPARRGMWVATGLVAGGALGNLADRIFAGEVTDYIAVGSWPPFNIADIAITCGVVLLALIYVREAEPESGAEGG
ncbi:MAG TPA: signal peptidase II [Solirubrobacterales bacterium]|nr:signal peptidase II [Solirubrobacterales bacterium]